MLFIIVTLGVTCGNLVSNYMGVYVAGVIAERELREVSEKAEESAGRAAAESKERQNRFEREQEERNRQALEQGAGEAAENSGTASFNV